MKKLILTIGIALVGCLSLSAQIIKSGNITANETWTNNNIYILNGWVYVKAGATVTIQPGTIIKGDFASKGALIVERDAKLVAQGTPEQPIVFTSQKSVGQRSYGDWGGVILCGRATVNLPANASLGTQAGEGVIEGGVGSLFGGGATPNDDDSSGVVSYVRIEYPGVAFQPNSEINGLTMGGVGRKTKIDHVQVSYSGDDAYEWFGGTVNCKYLVAYRAWDDDFDTDNGFSGKLQFLMDVRDPNIADQSGSNGFESDNDATGTGNTPLTHPIFSNVTVIGPLVNNATINSNFKRGLHLRRNTTTCVYNSVICGYPQGLLIESSTTQSNATNNLLQFRNNVLADMQDTLATTTAANPNNTNGAFNMDAWFNTAGFSNQIIPSTSSLLFTNSSVATPDLRLQAGSPLLTGASFSNPNLMDPFFTPVSYRGAFDGTNNWTACWTEWDSQNQAYNATINYTFAPSIAVTGATTFCQGGSVMLDATTAGGASYLWSPGGQTTPTINATASGTYSCTVWTANGCMAASNAVTVTVNPNPSAPTISASGPTMFCNGGSVDLTSSQTSGIEWTPGNMTTSMITVNSSGTYTVTYTDGNGCMASASQAVTVNPNPVAPSVTITGNTSFCTGDSVLLSSSQASGNQWMNNSNTISGATNQDYTVMASGNYTVEYTDANGCSATSSPVQVSVSSAPAPTVSVTGNTALCPGETVTLTASASDTYLWLPGGQTTQSITVSTAGSYSVTVTNSNACNGTGTSSAVTVTMNAAPTAAFNYVWNNTVVVFSNSSTGGTIYSWDFGDQSSSSAQNPQHQYLTNGTYTVTLVVTNASGCTDTITNVVQFFVGVQEHTVMNGITLYPNPANENVNLVLSMNKGADAVISIVDMNGRLVSSEQRTVSTGDNTVILDVTNLDNGIYFVRIAAGDASKVMKFVVNK